VVRWVIAASKPALLSATLAFDYPRCAGPG
jgi:hypothetical protein